jgi:hypothetical protein
LVCLALVLGLLLRGKKAKPEAEEKKDLYAADMAAKKKAAKAKGMSKKASDDEIIDEKADKDEEDEA